MISFGAVTGLIGIPVVLALVELVKRTFPDLPVRFYPVVSLLFAILINVGAAIYQHEDLGVSIIAGLVVGLSASGLYAGGRTLTGV